VIEYELAPSWLFDVGLQLAVAVNPEPDKLPVVQTVVLPALMTTVPVGTPPPETPVTVTEKTSEVSLDVLIDVVGESATEVAEVWLIVRVNF
jgi:hypothetical protein